MMTMYFTLSVANAEKTDPHKYDNAFRVIASVSFASSEKVWRQLEGRNDTRRKPTRDRKTASFPVPYPPWNHNILASNFHESLHCLSDKEIRQWKLNVHSYPTTLQLDPEKSRS